MLRFPAGFDSVERVKFILACYNAGYSRIADARRLARYFEADADSWSVVSTFLPLLAEQEYATHEVVHSGVFAGSEETIAYVAKVMRIYGRYKRKVTE
jgi:membrane-bound lytic murein transglycosylase F